MGAKSPAAPGTTTAPTAANKYPAAFGTPDEVDRAHDEIIKSVRAKLSKLKPGWYVCGLQAYQGQHPPRYFTSYGGVNFPVECADENPTVKNDSVEFNQRRKGQRQYLDTYNLRALWDAVGSKIVRTRSEEGRRYAILRVGGKTARRRLKGDLPLECFLYIKPADAPEPIDYSEVIDRAGEDEAPLFTFEDPKE